MDMVRVDVVNLHVDALFRGVLRQKLGQFDSCSLEEKGPTFQCCPDEVKPDTGVGMQRHERSLTLRAPWHKQKPLKRFLSSAAAPHPAEAHGRQGDCVTC